MYGLSAFLLAAGAVEVYIDLAFSPNMMDVYLGPMFGAVCVPLPSKLDMLFW